MSYTRFVIISHLRSGTHLLRTLLESHPAIVCQTEVFNSDNPRLPYPLATPTHQVLDQWVYRDFPDSIQCAGFVLQAYHPGGLKAFPGIRENPVWSDVWSLLQAMPDVRVIHLRRENSLRRHLSHVLARRSGDWHDWDEKRVATVSHIEIPKAMKPDRDLRAPVALDANRLRVDFEEVESMHQRVAEQFSEHPCFPLTYEQLCTQREKLNRELLDFLGVSQEPLQAAVSRLDSRPLQDSIENFEELKQDFANTRWQHFFANSET